MVRWEKLSECDDDIELFWKEYKGSYEHESYKRDTGVRGRCAVMVNACLKLNDLFKLIKGVGDQCPLKTA